MKSLGDSMIIFTHGKTWVMNPGQIGELNARGFGEKRGNKLLLSPEEAIYLSEKRKDFSIVDEDNNQVDYTDLMKFFSKKDKDFPKKYLVYKNLKERGYVVKTGFKFGTHFRVYPRGIKPGEGHSTWLVHVIDESHKCGFTEISRSVRLAQNVKKKMVFAVVDKEGDITYYKIERFTP